MISANVTEIKYLFFFLQNIQLSFSVNISSLPDNRKLVIIRPRSLRSKSRFVSLIFALTRSGSDFSVRSLATGSLHRDLVGGLELALLVGRYHHSSRVVQGFSANFEIFLIFFSRAQKSLL